MDIVEWITNDLSILFTNNYGSTEGAGSTITMPLSLDPLLLAALGSQTC